MTKIAKIEIVPKNAQELKIASRCKIDRLIDNNIDQIYLEIWFDKHEPVFVEVGNENVSGLGEADAARLR